jgi:hypothetical protein
VVDIGNGETITFPEFFQAIQAQAPLALQHERWLCLVKMAFIENRPEALMLAKQQAMDIQRGAIVSGNMPGMMPMTAMSQSFPTTYQPPQPIIFSPQITVSPQIINTPAFTNTPNQTSSPNQSRTDTRNTTPTAYSDGWEYSGAATFLGLFLLVLTLAILLA